MNIWILLPCFNELPNVRNLIKDINKNIILNTYNVKIVIIDDGSTDGIGKEFKKFSLNKKNKFFYIKHNVNKGLAITLNTGFNFILRKSSKDEDIIITMDADCTHPITYIHRMVKKIEDGNDIVIASRFEKKSRVVGLSLFRVILSNAASYIYRYSFRAGIKEFTCNFRAYKFALIKKSFSINSKFISETGFVCIPDILLKILKKNKNIKIAEVPFVLRYNLKQGESKIIIFSTIFKTLFLILKRKLINT